MRFDTAEASAILFRLRFHNPAFRGMGDVIYRPLDSERKMPLLLAFVLIGFFVWLSENISTFFGIWKYPSQLGACSKVHVGNGVHGRFWS